MSRTAHRPGSIAADAHHDETRARRRLRDQLRAARAELRADPTADVDIPPVRHRHNALWLA